MIKVDVKKFVTGRKNKEQICSYKSEQCKLRTDS